mgnify:CR=1 FL=1
MVDLVAEGEATMALDFSARIERVQEANEDLAVAWGPQIFELEAIAIPIGAANDQAARTVLKNLSDPNWKPVDGGEFFNSPVRIELGSGLQCTDGSCPCAGSNSCHSSCCTAARPGEMNGQSIVMDPEFWAEHGEGYEDRLLSEISR